MEDISHNALQGRVPRYPLRLTNTPPRAILTFHLSSSTCQGEEKMVRRERSSSTESWSISCTSVPLHDFALLFNVSQAETVWFNHLNPSHKIYCSFRDYTAIKDYIHNCFNCWFLLCFVLFASFESIIQAQTTILVFFFVLGGWVFFLSFFRSGSFVCRSADWCFCFVQILFIHKSSKDFFYTNVNFLAYILFYHRFNFYFAFLCFVWIFCI